MPRFLGNHSPFASDLSASTSYASLHVPAQDFPGCLNAAVAARCGNFRLTESSGVVQPQSHLRGMSGLLVLPHLCVDMHPPACPDVCTNPPDDSDWLLFACAAAEHESCLVKPRHRASIGSSLSAMPAVRRDWGRVYHCCEGSAATNTFGKPNISNLPQATCGAIVRTATFWHMLAFHFHHFV